MTTVGHPRSTEKPAIISQARRLPAMARPRRGPAEKASEQTARLASTGGPLPAVHRNVSSPPDQASVRCMTRLSRTARSSASGTHATAAAARRRPASASSTTASQPIITATGPSKSGLRVSAQNEGANAQQAPVTQFQFRRPGRVLARAHAMPPASRALSRCAATAALARRRSVSAASTVAPSSVSR